MRNRSQRGLTIALAALVAVGAGCPSRTPDPAQTDDPSPEPEWPVPGQDAVAAKRHFRAAKDARKEGGPGLKMRDELLAGLALDDRTLQPIYLLAINEEQRGEGDALFIDALRLAARRDRDPPEEKMAGTARGMLRHADTKGHLPSEEVPVELAPQAQATFATGKRFHLVLEADGSDGRALRYVRDESRQPCGVRVWFFDPGKPDHKGVLSTYWPCGSVTATIEAEDVIAALADESSAGLHLALVPPRRGWSPAQLRAGMLSNEITLQP